MARIDFELSDVDAISEKLEPVHNVHVNTLMPHAELIAARLESHGLTVTYLSTNLNSLHRHPGSHKSQSFSGTDLNTSHLHNTGIVYPLSSATSTPNFAGIMGHNKTVNRIAHFEYRVANGTVDPLTNSAITYAKGRCYAHITEPATPVSAVESLMGVIAPVSNYHKANSITGSPIIISEITDLWDITTFEHDTRFIDPTNIVEKVYAPVTLKPVTTTTPTTHTSDDSTDSVEYTAYIEACEDLEFLTTVELENLDYPNLWTTVCELADFVEEDTESLFECTSVELIETYDVLKRIVLDELAEASHEPVLTFTEQLNYDFMKSKLLQHGIHATKLADIPIEQLNILYNTIFPKG